MRHISVLAAGLMTSTIIAGLCMAAPDDQGQSAPADQSVQTGSTTNETQGADQSGNSDQPATSDQVQASDRAQSPSRTATDDLPQPSDQAATSDQASAAAPAEDGTEPAEEADANDQPTAETQSPAVSPAKVEEQATDRSGDDGDRDATSKAEDPTVANDSTVADVAVSSPVGAAGSAQPDAATPTDNGAQTDGGPKTESQPEKSAASDNAASASQTTEAKSADTDFGRLSMDGASAFEDIHLARLAIFDGNTVLAAKLVGDAQASLDKAKTDNTAFIKAESELNGSSEPHAGPRQPHAKDSEKIAWLPIDGQITIGEDFNPTKENAAAISSARRNIKSGQTDEAMKALKLAAVDVDFTMALAPLQQTLADVDMANKLMDDHDYFGASQALKQAEDGVRYNEIDDVAHVRGDTAKTDQNATNNNG